MRGLAGPLVSTGTAGGALRTSSRRRAVSSRLLRVVGAAGSLSVYRVTAGGLPVVLGLVISARWGLRELALFTVANATINVATVVVDWGATRALPRNLAVFGDDAARRFLASANGFRLSLFAALVAAASLAVATHVVSTEVAVYLGILAPLCAVALFTTNAVSERIVAHRTRGIALAVAASMLTFLVLAAVVVRADFGARLLVAAYVAAKVVEAVVMLAGRFRMAAVRCRGMTSAAAALWPFGAQMIMAVLYSRAAVFAAEWMTSSVEFGVFSVAVALQSAMLLVPVSLALVCVPGLATRVRHGRSVRPLLVGYTTVSLAAIVGELAVLAWGAGRVAAALNVPRPYLPFVLAFAALAVFSVFSTMLGVLLQAQGRERLVARLSALTLGFALVYQAAAVTRWGLWGVLGAVAAAELTTVAVFAAALGRAGSHAARGRA